MESEEEDDGLPRFEDAYTLDPNDVQFVSEIGKGSFGVVYKGLFFGTEVAIKCISKTLIEEQGLEKFIRRELYVSRFSHPNIVQFIGVCDKPESDELLLVTEYVPGGDLRSILKDKKIEIPWLLRAKMAYDIACAMAYLHSKKILHRDLKSKNLLISYNWKVKLCDFGLARQYESGSSRPMTICGTESHMASEIILGQPYDEKCDVFSYGVVLFELITRLKAKTSIPRAIAKGYKIDPVEIQTLFPPDAPTSFAQLTLDCVHDNPKERPSFSLILKRLEIVFRQIEASLHPVKESQSPKTSSSVKPNETQKPQQPSPPSSNIQSPKFTPPLTAEKRSGSFNLGKVKSVDFNKLKTLKFTNSKNLEEAVAKFFNSSSFSGWLTVGYSDVNVLTYQNSGSGSVDELIRYLYDDQVQYILLRLPIVDKEDGIVQKTRDIFIHWLGDKVPITQRGRKSSHVGQVQGLLKPYHSELTAISKQNFNLKNVIARSEPLSGSHVLD